MESQQLTELFPGAFGIFILVILVIWAILTFFMPFMVYSIMRSNKDLLNLNKKILAELQGKGRVKDLKRVDPELS